MPHRRRRGATLIELLVTVGVFTFIVLSLFAVTRDGTQSWKAVETRSDVQSALRNFERDITTELRRTSINAILIWPPRNTASTVTGYKHAIVMRSAMNDYNYNSMANYDASATSMWQLDPLSYASEPQYYFYSRTPPSPGATTPPPMTNPPEPNWQRWVLYYLTRPAGDTCAAPADPDNVCPHKWLIRKDIDISVKLGTDANNLVTPPANSGGPFIEGDGSEPSEASLYAEQEPPAGSAVGSHIRRVRILARDIIAFNVTALNDQGTYTDNATRKNGMPNYPSGYKTIAFDIKAYNRQQNESVLTTGQKALATDNFNANDPNHMGLPWSQNDQFGVQLDNKVVPLNPVDTRIKTPSP